MAAKQSYLKIVKGQPAQKSACPLCQQEAKDPHTPFCSRRCAQLDLGKWLTGDYSIPAHEAMDDSDVEMLISAHQAKNETQPDEDS